MSGGSGFGMNVEGLHGTGRTVSGRSADGGSSARALKNGLDAASGQIGHHRVRTALNTFLSDNVIDDANKLEGQVDAAGIGVSNVAGTARDGDNEAANLLRKPINDATAAQGRAGGPSPR